MSEHDEERDISEAAASLFQRDARSSEVDQARHARVLTRALAIAAKVYCIDPDSVHEQLREDVSRVEVFDGRTRWPGRSSGAAQA